MIGLGNWACKVNSMFFSGEVKINIFDNNGTYGFEIDIPDVDIPDIDIKKVEEDDENADLREWKDDSEGGASIAEMLKNN